MLSDRTEWDTEGWKICRSWISIDRIMARLRFKTGLESQTALDGAVRVHIYLGNLELQACLGTRGLWLVGWSGYRYLQV